MVGGGRRQASGGEVGAVGGWLRCRSVSWVRRGRAGLGCNRRICSGSVGSPCQRKKD